MEGKPFVLSTLPDFAGYPVVSDYSFPFCGFQERKQIEAVFSCWKVVFFFSPFQTFFLACISLEFWLESDFFFLSRNMIMKEYAIQKICPFVLESFRGNGAYFPKVVPKSRVYSTPGLV